MSKKIDFGGWIIISAVVATVLIVAIIAFALGVSPTVHKYEYEYETVDGETGIAKYCYAPSRSVPYCRLDDGTRVYSIKKYKTITKKEQE